MKIFTATRIFILLIAVVSVTTAQSNPGSVLKGKVFLTDKEHPVVGAMIFLIPIIDSKKGPEIAAVKTDDHGDYEFKNVPEGKYTISIKSYYKKQEDLPCKFLLAKTRNPVLALVVMQEKGQYVQHVMSDEFSIKGTKEVVKNFDVTCTQAFGP